MNKYFEIEKAIKKNFYEITLQEDMNDADYMYKTVTYGKEEFESDELLQLVLCYLNMPYTYPKAEFGHYYSKDENLSWLYDYLDYEDLLTYMEWGPSHTIACINITYYDEESVAHPVKLISLENLLKDKETLFKHMTDLYNKILKNDE